MREYDVHKLMQVKGAIDISFLMIGLMVLFSMAMFSNCSAISQTSKKMCWFQILLVCFTFNLMIYCLLFLHWKMCNFDHRAIWEYNQFLVYRELNVLFIFWKLTNALWQIETNQLGSKAGEQLLHALKPLYIFIPSSLPLFHMLVVTIPQILGSG